jgi:hypothetical protein
MLIYFCPSINNESIEWNPDLFSRVSVHNSESCESLEAMRDRWCVTVICQGQASGEVVTNNPDILYAARS